MYIYIQFENIFEVKLISSNCLVRQNEISVKHTVANDKIYIIYNNAVFSIKVANTMDYSIDCLTQLCMVKHDKYFY